VKEQRKAPSPIHWLLSSSAASLLAALLLFLVCLAVLHPRYAINDDMKIIAILAGYPAGGGAPFPIFSNAVLGIVLVPLYSLHTSINWEIWFFVLVDLLSTWALLYVVLSASTSRGWKVLGAAIVVLSVSYFALNITFTNAAGLACFAGFCLVISSARATASVYRTPAVGGIALIAAGSLIRIEMLALTLPIVITALLFTVPALHSRNLQIALAAALIVVAAGMVFDRLYVRFHSDWNLYYFYNKTAQQLQDAHRLDNAGMAIKHISWTKNDQEMFARSFFPDAGIYSVERIQYLIRHVAGSGANPLDSGRALLQRLVSPAGLPAALMVLAVWLLVFARRLSPLKMLAVSAVVAVSLAENLFLVWAYKNPDYSLFTSLACTAMLDMLLIIWPDADSSLTPVGQATEHARLYDWAGALFVVVAVAFGAYRALVVSNDNLNKQRAYHQIIADIQQLQSDGILPPDAIIYSPSSGIPWEWSNPLALEFPPIPFMDTGWITFSPYYEHTLDGLGLRPFPAALYQNPSVYVMTKRIVQGFFRIYFSEHGHAAVTFEPVYEMPNPYHVVGYDDRVLYKITQVK
jgi:hypothetical protein